MGSFTVSYDSKWQLDFAPNYQFTSCGKCFNVKTGRQLKMVVKGTCRGFNIFGKFYSLETLRKHLEKIEEPICPF